MKKCEETMSKKKIQISRILTSLVGDKSRAQKQRSIPLGRVINHRREIAQDTHVPVKAMGMC